MSRNAAKYDGFVALESLDPEARKLVEMLQHQIELLREKLKESNPEANVEEYTLAEAQAALNDAAVRLMNGDEAAQADFDKWDKIICEHPDHLAKLARERVEWEESQGGSNKAALAITKGYVPENIKSISVAALKESGLPQDLAKRIFTQKALWLVRLPQSQIAKLHIVDLKTKFSTQGLDLIELRAVYHSLPVEFENDPSGEKQQWRETLRKKLELCITEDNKGKLASCKFRHACYIDTVDMKPVSMPFGQNVLEEERTELEALQQRAVEIVRKARKPRTPKRAAGSQRPDAKLKMKANLAAMLAARSGGKPPQLRNPAKRSTQTCERSRSEEQKQEKDLIPPNVPQTKTSSGQGILANCSRIPSKVGTGSSVKHDPSTKFEAKIAQFEAKLSAARGSNTLETKAQAAQKVKKLNIPTDFRRKLVSLQSSNRGEVDLPEDKGWAKIENSAKQEQPQPENTEAAEDKEWQALERSLCLQERPLTEQVNMLERLLHVLLSSSLYRKKRPTECRVPEFKTSSLSDSVEAFAECQTSSLESSGKGPLHDVKAESPYVQTTLDNLKTVFNKRTTASGIHQGEQSADKSKTLRCPVVLENTKDTDWLIVNKN